MGGLGAAAAMVCPMDRDLLPVWAAPSAADGAVPPGCLAHLAFFEIRKKFLSRLRLVNFITSSEDPERLPFRIKGLRAGT